MLSGQFFDRVILNTLSMSTRCPLAQQYPLDLSPDHSMLDETNPRSLISIVPECLVPVIKACRKQYPKLFLHNEKLLRQKIKVDDRDEKIRLNFWEEYNQAQASMRPMKVNGIISGVCFSETWSTYYLRRLDKIAFMLCPPKNYSLAMRNVLNKGVDRLLEIMELPITDAAGKPNIPAITQILKVFQLVDMRVKGAIVQRLQIQQHSLNFNTDVSADYAKAQADRLNSMSLDQLEELDKRLARGAEQEQKLLDVLPEELRKELVDQPTPIPDVTPKEISLDVFDEPHELEDL